MLLAHLELDGVLALCNARNNVIKLGRFVNSGEAKAAVGELATRQIVEGGVDFGTELGIKRYSGSIGQANIDASFNNFLRCSLVGDN